ncbi:DNA-binding barrel domain superfamily [Sesbania bispinosa]|nr:DNA-binding barrel domain superfamily [Sesbania bispinosa]
MSFHHDTSAFSFKFNKVIQDPDRQKKELRIPPAVVMKYWKVMPNPILLKLPNGAGWEISWESHDSGIWLKKNWNKFAQSLSLGYGYFLVFKYKGGSNFLVEVFHYNSLEIDYSSIRCINDGEGSNEHQKQIVEEEDCLEIVDLCERLTQPLKKKKANPSEECKNYNNPHFEANNAPSKRISINGKRKMNAGANRGDIIKAKNYSSKKAEVKEMMAKNFHLENPFFILILKPSYVQSNILMVPCEFSRKYLKDLEGITIIQVDGDENRCGNRVSFKFCDPEKRTRFSTGWKLFTHKYNLQAGDCCIFEMTQQAPPLSFKVTIIRAKELPSFMQLKDSVESHDINQNTFQLVLVTKNQPHCIPRWFMERHRCNGKFVKLKVEETSWDVRVICNYPNVGFGRFCGGWPAFVRECKLNIGDICKFEMVDEEKLVLKVSITKCGQQY